MKLLIREASGYVSYPEYKPEHLADHGITETMVDMTATGMLSVYHDPEAYDTRAIVVNRLTPDIIEIIKIRLMAGKWR